MIHVVLIINALEREQSSQCDSIAITESGRGAKAKKFKTIVSQWLYRIECSNRDNGLSKGKEFIQRVNNCIKSSLIVVANKRNIKLGHCHYSPGPIIKKKMRQKHIHIIMMNSEEEFGINQFVDLLKNKLDLIVHKKEKQSWNKKDVG